MFLQIKKTSNGWLLNKWSDQRGQSYCIMFVTNSTENWKMKESKDSKESQDSKESKESTKSKNSKESKSQRVEDVSKDYHRFSKLLNNTKEGATWSACVWVFWQNMVIYLKTQRGVIKSHSFNILEQYNITCYQIVVKRTRTTVSMLKELMKFANS